MPPARTGRRAQVAVDVEEGGAGDMPDEICATTRVAVGEIPPAVDELVAQRYQLPSGEAGSATELGWITYAIPPVAFIHASSNCVRS